MRCAKALLGATTATATALLVMSPATAGEAAPTVETIAENLMSPLQVQAYPGGALVNETTEDGADGRILAIQDSGQTETVVEGQGPIGGFDYTGNRLAFTATKLTAQGPVSRLKLLTVAPGRLQRGVVTQVENVANLSRYEARKNPDGGQTYGIAKLGDCKVPKKIRQFFEPYKGIVESNPYAVAAAQDGGWYVADAAANAIVHVADGGKVSTAAVLPVQRIRLTKARVEAFGLKPCAIGKTMRYEPVPTDVEEAANGRLFVTLLPGGEGPTANRGLLVRVNPDNGKVRTFAKRFTGATNLALAPGRIFVSELFGNKITSVSRASGAKSTYSEQMMPASVDWLGGALYATTEVFGPAKLIKLTEGVVVD